MPPPKKNVIPIIMGACVMAGGLFIMRHFSGTYASLPALDAEQLAPLLAPLASSGGPPPDGKGRNARLDAAISQAQQAVTNPGDTDDVRRVAALGRAAISAGDEGRVNAVILLLNAAAESAAADCVVVAISGSDGRPEIVAGPDVGEASLPYECLAEGAGDAQRLRGDRVVHRDAYRFPLVAPRASAVAAADFAASHEMVYGVKAGGFLHPVWLAPSLATRTGAP